MDTDRLLLVTDIAVKLLAISVPSDTVWTNAMQYYYEIHTYILFFPANLKTSNVL